ncbi:unknown [Bacteroides sp. CAG:633]|uniref:hypothetical protein n=1 Tax=Bacteroides sp. CAG:633 TaxID=1262744 RepID=UPI0003370F36|nr:hypothetical protein [Bacteroides sp. CAG:633]CDB12113.1 unknown [Bacteroides sp. CAG:633]
MKKVELVVSGEAGEEKRIGVNELKVFRMVDKRISLHEPLTKEDFFSALCQSNEEGITVEIDENNCNFDEIVNALS